MVAAFDREACRRLPLAESALRLLDFVTEDEYLAEIFAEHRGASYEKVISFPLFVHLIGDALLGHQASGHRSFQRAKEQKRLPASIKAIYGKLQRIPIGLSLGFLAQTTRRLQQVFPGSVSLDRPAALREFDILALDGKKIKHVAKRLKALRQVKGLVLGGKLVVGLDLNTGLVLGMGADPDGEISDAPLVPEVLDQLREKTRRKRLFVCDRQFCDLNQPKLQGANGDQWLIRYSKKVGFHPDPARPARVGEDERGRTYVEEWGWLGAESDSRRAYCRRITLQRPDEEDVVLVTSLLDGKKYPACALLSIYLARWDIECVFQQVTEVFDLKALIGSAAEATVFQAAFCFLLYNLIVVLRAYLSEAREEKPEVISSEKLFEDVKRQFIAWQEVIGTRPTREVLGPTLDAQSLRMELRRLLAAVWTERWRKAKPRKKPVKHPEREYLKGGHDSVHRITQRARQKEERDQQKSKQTT